jgi:hypothetical protein
VKLVPEVVLAVHFKIEFPGGYRYDAEELHKLLLELQCEGALLAANKKLEKVLLKLQVIALGLPGWKPGPNLASFMMKLEAALASERMKVLLEYKEGKVA